MKARPLPDIVGVDNLLRARLIKIDVEGAEGSVIGGLTDLLPRFCDSTEWVFELNPDALVDQGMDTASILNCFRGAGYKLFRIENDYSDETYFPPATTFHLDEINADAPPRTQIDIIATKRHPGIAPDGGRR